MPGYWPVNRRHKDVMRPMPQQDPTRETKTSSAISRGHVLIVDEETSAREFTDHVLRSAGYITVRAMNGEEALEIAEQFGPFDLLVTDEQTPRMAGHELAKRLREREPWLKVIYLTGHTEQLFEAKGPLVGRGRPRKAVVRARTAGDSLDAAGEANADQGLLELRTQNLEVRR
jgi:CheY-like chemotaxis protein